MRARANGSDLVTVAGSGMIFPLPVTAVSFTIQGHLVSMKNNRQFAINRATGRKFSRKSDEALRYSADFLVQVPPGAKRGLGSKRNLLRAIVSVWYASWRSDLDCSLVYDLLQKAGVVSNDRWIRCKMEYAEVDAKNPRVEITIEPI